MAGKEIEFYRGVDSAQYHKSKKRGNILDAVFGMMSNMMDGNANMLEGVYLQGNLPSEHIFASQSLDNFHVLPPTLLVFGEHDFLVFEDFVYARHLTKVGGPLKTILYWVLGHGFAEQIEVMPQAEDLMGEIA